MMLQSKDFLFQDELPWETPGEGITRQVMAYSPDLMMVKVCFEKGAIGYLHQHIHSQVSYVASGKFEVTIGNEKMVLAAGDGFNVLPNLVHGVLCIETGVLIDVFNPMREDFLPKI